MNPTSSFILAKRGASLTTVRTARKFRIRIIGRAVRLDGKPANIVGVLPRDFEFAPANSAPVWVPIHQTGDLITRRSLHWLTVVGRLAPGFSPCRLARKCKA